MSRILNHVSSGKKSFSADEATVFELLQMWEPEMPIINYTGVFYLLRSLVEYAQYAELLNSLVLRVSDKDFDSVVDLLLSKNKELPFLLEWIKRSVSVLWLNNLVPYLEIRREMAQEVGLWVLETYGEEEFEVLAMRLPTQLFSMLSKIRSKDYIVETYLNRQNKRILRSTFDTVKPNDLRDLIVNRPKVIRVLLEGYYNIFDLMRDWMQGVSIIPFHMLIDAVHSSRTNKDDRNSNKNKEVNKKYNEIYAREGNLSIDQQRVLVKEMFAILSK